MERKSLLSGSTWNQEPTKAKKNEEAEDQEQDDKEEQVIDVQDKDVRKVVTAIEQMCEFYELANQGVYSLRKDVLPQALQKRLLRAATMHGVKKEDLTIAIVSKGLSEIEKSGIGGLNDFLQI